MPILEVPFPSPDGYPFPANATTMRNGSPMLLSDRIMDEVSYAGYAVTCRDISPSRKMAEVQVNNQDDVNNIIILLRLMVDTSVYEYFAVKLF